MPDDRWTTWQAEQAGTRRSSAGHWSTLFLLIVVALIALQVMSDYDPAAKPYTGPPACGRNWPPTCDQEPAKR